MNEQLFKDNFCVSYNFFYIIYSIICRRCVLQYLGERGQPLHVWVNGHQYVIVHHRTEVSCGWALQHQTWRSWSFSLLKTMVHVYRSCDSKCESGIREVCLIREQSSGLIVYVTCPLPHTFECFCTPSILLMRLPSQEYFYCLDNVSRSTVVLVK